MMTPFDNEIDQLLSQAEELLQDDKPTEALALLDRARKLQPRHAWMMLFRGVALGQLGRADEATEQLIAAADEHSEDIDIQVDAARHLSLLEQYQDALICAQRAINLDANDAGGQSITGEILERMGRIAEAVPHREQAIASEPNDLDSRYFLAVNYCDLGQYEDAYALAEILSQDLPEDPDIIRLNGACHSYLGRHHDALARWAELERIEGLTPNLLHNRASTLDVLGLRDEALATINEAITADPDLALNYYTRGMIYEHMEEDGPAIDDYIEALTHDPDHLDAVINLVELASTTDTIPTIMERLNRLLSFSPEASKLLYAKGRLQMESGELLEGIATLEEAVRHEPALGIAWYTLTMLYGMTGDLNASVIATEHALRFFPDDQGLWFNRGLALHDLHRFPEAMSCYDHAIDLAPEDPYPWLQLGRLLLLDLERPADARGVLKEVLALQPDNLNALWMLCLSNLRIGRLEEARTDLSRLQEVDPDYLWGQLVHAAYYVQLGNFDAAFDQLAMAALQGYDTHLLLSEPLFEPLWTDPRFDKFLGSGNTHTHPNTLKK